MQAFRFQLPLIRTLMLHGVPHTRREGILLERSGNWAEASPLPSFSQESIDDVIAALRGQREPPASLRFALQSLDDPISKTASVPFNYLLQGDLDDLRRDVEKCNQTKCSTVKLKVGRSDLPSDIAMVLEVRSRLKDDINLRLDANQAWSIADAVEFARAIQDTNYEYIEEPLQDASRLEDLHTQTGVRYALDETLSTGEALDQFPNAAALICKPTILGGREAADRLAATGKPIVFSAAFESGV